MDVILIEQLEREGIKLKNPGRQNTVLCPECSAGRSPQNKNKPVLSVNLTEDGGARWNCHHCGWSGGVSGRERHQELPPKRAPSYQRPHPDKQGAREQSLYDWFKRRGISPDTVDACGITTRQEWMPGDEQGKTSKVVCFPYRRGTELINMKFRTSDKRFKQTKGAEKIYFGMNDLDGFETAIVVEGELDKMALMEAGVRNVISVPDGAPQVLKDAPPTPDEDTGFSYVHNCEQPLAHIQRWVIAVDGDAPGRVLAEELARRYGKEKCMLVRWPELGDISCKDANDVLMAHGPEALKDCIAEAEPFPVIGMFKLNADDLIAMRNSPVDRGVSTGWVHLDSYYRVAPGLLTVVTGLPGSGKSEWLDALMVNLADLHGWSFAVCSLENPLDEHGGKLIEKKMGVPFRNWSPDTVAMTDDVVREATAWANKHFTFIRDEGDEPQTLDWVLERARSAVVRHGIRGLVIDPYNELENARGPNQTETEYVGRFLQRLKRFAARHGVHVWLVAHPAKLYADRGRELPAPGMYDISGSANWANKADIGITIHRPDLKLPEVEVHIRKMKFRRCGQVGVEYLRWNKNTGQYQRAYQEEVKL